MRNKILNWTKHTSKDLWETYRRWFCRWFEKSTGSKCEERTKSTIVIVTIIVILIIFAVKNIFSDLILPRVKDAIVGKSIVNQNIAQVSSVYKGVDIQKKNETTNTQASSINGCDLENGRWSKSFGQVNQDTDDERHFILAEKSEGGLYKYLGKIENIEKCKFIFIPRGTKTINYVISLDEIYQIVIGDNDLSTVTFRGIDSLGGKALAIKESDSGKTRPRLLEDIKIGTEVNVYLEQSLLSDGKYKMIAKITYFPDSNNDNQREQVFSWTFFPSPKILNQPSLSVGMIRAKGDSSEIGVNFIYPNIAKLLSR